MADGGAVPPEKIRRSRPGRWPVSRQCSSIPNQIVGTAAAMVTPSSTISRCSHSLSARRPGSTSFAPYIGARNGTAQPLQWKNPGMPRTVSLADKAQPLPPPVDSADSTVPRCEYSTPFG